MTRRKWERALIAKLKQQGATHEEARSTDASLFFTSATRGGKGFFVPRPLEEFTGWTEAQQNEIASTLEYFGLELWPLDMNIVYSTGEE